VRDDRARSDEREADRRPEPDVADAAGGSWPGWRLEVAQALAWTEGRIWWEVSTIENRKKQRTGQRYDHFFWAYVYREDSLWISVGKNS
jgi:hypothetical protein